MSSFCSQKKQLGYVISTVNDNVSAQSLIERDMLSIMLKIIHPTKRKHLGDDESVSLMPFWGKETME